MAPSKARKKAAKKPARKRAGKPVGRKRAAGRAKAARAGPRKKRAAARKPARAAAAKSPFAAAPQPPVDRDPAKLHPVLRQKLEAALAALQQGGASFKLVEGFRTLERQQWLFGAGRTGVPFARPGEPVVTHADGVASRSKHQGDGAPGTGRAADCYPLKDGKVVIPNAADPVWRRYADAVTAQGLEAGFHWPSFKDAPHCQLP